MGIGLSLLAVAVCSWFILYISRRCMNLEMPVQRTAAKILIYLFKVVVQQGTKQTDEFHIKLQSINLGNGRDIIFRNELQTNHSFDGRFGFHLESHRHCHRQRLQLECHFVFVDQLQETGSEHF